MMEEKKEATPGSEKAVELAESLLVHAFDANEMEFFLDHFTPYAVWYVNTAAPATGREAIRQMVLDFKKTMHMKTSRHYNLSGFVSSMGDAGSMVTMFGDVDYEVEGNPNVICKFCDVCSVDSDGKISELRTFIDMSPLTQGV